MNEIIYYGAHNANFATQYNLRDNDDDFAKVKFKLENEEISIYLLENDDTATLLCDFTTLKAAGATKIHLPAPINACKWNMYPVLGLRGTAKAMQLEKVKHYSASPLYSSANKCSQYSFSCQTQISLSKSLATIYPSIRLPKSDRLTICGCTLGDSKTVSITSNAL